MNFLNEIFKEYFLNELFKIIYLKDFLDEFI